MSDFDPVPSSYTQLLLGVTFVLLLTALEYYVTGGDDLDEIDDDDFIIGGRRLGIYRRK